MAQQNSFLNWVSNNIPTLFLLFGAALSIGSTMAMVKQNGEGIANIRVVQLEMQLGLKDATNQQQLMSQEFKQIYGFNRQKLDALGNRVSKLEEHASQTEKDRFRLSEGEQLGALMRANTQGLHDVKNKQSRNSAIIESLQDTCHDLRVRIERLENND